MLLQVQHVTRRFGADPLFEDVSLDIPDNGRVALVGRNGAGKSTLIHIITGEEAPDEGEVTTKRGLTIGYLAQDTGLDSDKTVWEEMLSVFDDLIELETKIHQLETKMSQPNVIENEALFNETSALYDRLQHEFNERNGFGYQAEIRGVLHGFEFDESYFNRSITTLSGGQKTQLALAKLLLEKRDLLILDEPTNHLDVETLTWLEGYIQSYKGALLIVSHDRYFLDRIVNEVYDMSLGSVEHYKGNYSKFMDLKAEKLKREWKEYEKQQDKISKLEDFVNKNIVRASTTKRAQARRKQLEKMDVMDKPESDDKVARFRFHADRDSGNIVLTVKDLAVGYDASTVLADPVNLDIKKKQAIAIVGPNGVGKSTLLKTILGKIPPIHGTIQLGAGVEIGYYDQEQATLHPKKTVLAELWDDHPMTPEGDIRSILGSFLFTGEDVDKPVHNLSGGEKARLLLTKLAMKHDNFLILDEPTNHLDIDSREVLELALNEFNGTILFVSHDRYFINQVATSVVEISKAGSTLFLGDYDYFINKKQEQAEIEALEEQENPASNAPAASSVPTKQTSYQQSKDVQRKQRKLSREVDALEEQITTLSDKKEAIELAMTQPEAFNDQAKMTELQNQLSEVSDSLAETESDWEAKSIELEEYND
ncbi:multidrug ABC transporter ATP-binding protein [Secundilactobacillus oryzae JCM 18671]|uniref:Multidrug ABC transporter ATP-binding protein n=1 Tax=Secundilactobacillus oryzae JCM 18671 TaxID=1291743 RepID=A0A081BK17_9LACO|nr:ABC-F family ATP-binding cassette domain-containing protein [Secundilactobacillus oryzae]GAK48385.1 multidrug ABC transporter ATP-binding protein [Secundilactobacillus oryzae JCM 18671]